MASKKTNNEDFLAKWAAGDLTDQELKHLTSTDDSNLYKKILASSEKIVFSPYDVERELIKLNSKKEEQPKAKIRQFHILRYAVAAIMLIGIAFVYYLTLPDYTVHSTKRGQSLLVDLPDGSTVSLSGNTELKYLADSYSQNRLIKLNGEAFFNVIKGAHFEVETSEGNVLVLGTTFNVDQRSRILNVICFSGKVNVFNQTSNSDLLPGDAIRIENGRKTKTWKVLREDIPSWMNGVTEIHEANLQVAIEALQNVFDIKVKTKVDLREIPFDGAFPHNDIEIALRSILGTSKIDYTYQKDRKEVTIQSKE